MRARLSEVTPVEGPQLGQTEEESRAKAAAAADAERRSKSKLKLVSAFQPLEAPPLPISNDKQQRLKELLRKYKADEISPEQYHLERAKILSAP